MESGKSGAVKDFDVVEERKRARAFTNLYSRLVSRFGIIAQPPLIPSGSFTPEVSMSK